MPSIILPLISGLYTFKSVYVNNEEIKIFALVMDLGFVTDRLKLLHVVYKFRLLLKI